MTLIWVFPHTGSVALSLDAYVRTSNKLATPGSRGRRAAFEQAYTIASQIVALRQKRGLTQKQLAERSGIAQSEISRIERGSIHPTEPTLVRLAHALDADLRIVERTTDAVSQPA